jgi:L-rhamnose mutarotase
LPAHVSIATGSSAKQILKTFTIGDIMSDSYTVKAASLMIIFSVLIGGCTGAHKPKRYGMVIGIKEQALTKYKELHAKPWPEVTVKLKDVNIQNYSIYLIQFPDGNYYLFSYFEYTGNNFDADMKRMADDPKTQEWWGHTKPMQIPLANRPEGQWWMNMEEVFHLD